MQLSTHLYFLEFIRPFALAHGTRTGTNLVFVKLEHEGIIGYGEASLPPYRNETVVSVTNWINSKREEIEFALQKELPKNLELIPFSKENPAASAAVETALFDWYAKSKNKRLSEFFEQTNNSPELTLTITKNDFDFLSEKLLLAKNFSQLKIKLTGNDDDLDFVKALRAKTDMPFCIDANQGYSKKEDAVRLIGHLEKLNCSIIEQPLKDVDHDGHFWLKQRTFLPLVADESIQNLEQLKQFHDAYSGVNIKLMKCGGLAKAVQMIKFAGEKSLLKFIGCMSESSLSVADASVLASQCDMADLDSPYLNKNDPFSGFHITNGKIEIEGEIGVGVQVKKGVLF